MPTITIFISINLFADFPVCKPIVTTESQLR